MRLINKVLPCPFCGGDPFEGHTGGLNFIIKCYECGVVMEHDRRDKVRGEWNKRVNDPKILKRKSSLLTGILRCNHWDNYARNLISDVLKHYTTTRRR